MIEHVLSGYSSLHQHSKSRTRLALSMVRLPSLLAVVVSPNSLERTPNVANIDAADPPPKIEASVSIGGHKLTSGGMV